MVACLYLGLIFEIYRLGRLCLKFYYSVDVLRLTPTNGTLVIAPAALIYHWESEIKARCEDGLLKIVIYHNNWKKVQFPV